MSSKLRTLTGASYAVAFLLVVLPALSVAGNILPFQWGQVQWRFGLAGLMASSLALPLAGVLLAMVTAAIREHRRTARTLAVISFLTAIFGVLAIIMLSLDIVQLRPDVRVEALPRFDSAAGIAIAQYVLGILGALFLGVGGWKAGRKSAYAPPPPTRSAAADDESGVLIGS